MLPLEHSLVVVLLLSVQAPCILCGFAHSPLQVRHTPQQQNMISAAIHGDTSIENTR
jgi:hypothetical protein